ncbi:MAG: hypothetical protein L3J16_06290 [Anaerolineales bacterium]|nr:hypothetical protein [Anaerolineales bacterium]
MSQFDGLLWLLLMLAPLLVLQRALHREVQAIFLILTRRPAVTMAIFSLIFFPGVVLHEFSHFLVAKLIGVRTGDFSLIPRSMPDGHVRLGYVEVSKTDMLRDSLIGAAPLIFGGLFISYAAIYQLGLLPLWEFFRSTQFSAFWTGLFALPNAPDFALWFYLTFAVSSTMLPSPSDRHAWLPLLGVITLLVGLAAVAGAGNWMLVNLAPPLNVFLRSVAMLFGLSTAVHGLLILPLMLAHKLLTRITGLDSG